MSAERPVRNEWQQQQSGGMILRRGSVVAAFLLCLLAKVRAFLCRLKKRKGEKTSTKGQSVQPRLGCTLIASVSPRNQRARVPCANIMCSPLLAGLLQVAKQVALRKVAQLRVLFFVFCLSSTSTKTPALHSLFCLPTGVRGIRTIRVANLVDAQRQRRAAERHVL